MAAYPQNKTDLSNVKFNEDPKVLMNGNSDIREGKMFDNADMISYGVQNKTLSFNGYIPDHIEILSYKGTLAGYAFKIRTLTDQNKLATFIKDKYKNITIRKSRLVTVYTYKDNAIVIDFQEIDKEQFKNGATGYLSVKRTDFYNIYEELMKQYSKP
ncbi:hypothetical protein ATK78_4148 [Pedobacter metabolipauper]|uniref:Uncharacterized protein n=2 Tax=Pedobacter metabolipauper TaxID=425513 RepID=A0A4R6SRQ9_9SPHI|nr:hypothetical protein ATK78_4148 [Pedobacter metabolipauper]